MHASKQFENSYYGWYQASSCEGEAPPPQKKKKKSEKIILLLINNDIVTA